MEFTDALDNRFADINRAYSWIEPFHIFDWETRSLYKHYEYSQRHLSRILKDERKEIDEVLNSPGCPAELFDIYDEMFSIDSDYLLDINSEATLLMLYTLFENLLSSLVKYAVEKESCPVFVKKSSGQPQINQYFTYLRNDCGYDFYIKRQYKDQLYLMRKIRNYFVHDNKGTDSIDLNKFKDIEVKPEIKDDKLYISREYIISCFELTLEIAKVIENAMTQ